MYISGDSLSDVVSVSPGRWTLTAKMKVVVGLVLGWDFVCGLSSVDGNLTGDNIMLDGRE
jgi:hypothetical protein